MEGFDSTIEEIECKKSRFADIVSTKHKVDNRVKVVECDVLYWNKYSNNFAFNYNGTNVQVTLAEPIKECNGKVKVKVINGIYELI